jgi:hypothetical protein
MEEQGDGFKGSDIDLFLYGFTTDEDANEKVHIFSLQCIAFTYLNSWNIFTKWCARTLGLLVISSALSELSPFLEIIQSAMFKLFWGICFRAVSWRITLISFADYTKVQLKFYLGLMLIVAQLALMVKTCGEWKDFAVLLTRDTT